MPQISQLLEVYGSQFFWLLIVIGIIYFGIAKNMVPKISKTVDDRQKRITDDLAAAQGAQDKAEQIEADYRTSINDARAEEADAALKAAKTAALKEIEAVAAEAAQAIVTTVSGAKVSATDAKKAVKAAF